MKTHTTGSGALSTTLVETYRDVQGRLRQRVIANLHGEPDISSALAKRDALRKEQEALVADCVHADEFHDGR